MISIWGIWGQKKAFIRDLTDMGLSTYMHRYQKMEFFVSFSVYSTLLL
jgi:hypothetical protein